MYDSHPMKIRDDSDDLQSYSSFISITNGGFSSVEEIKQCTLLDQFHDETELGWSSNGSKHQNDIGMSVFCQHVHFVVEFTEELFTDVGIEDLFDGDVEIEVLSFVDGAESSH
jgi:hypothetical protein